MSTPLQNPMNYKKKEKDKTSIRNFVLFLLLKQDLNLRPSD